MAAGALVLFLSAFSLTEYLDYINADQLAKSVKNVVPLLTVLMAWVGIWTFVGNVSGGSGSFSVHLCVAALAGAVLLLLNEPILPMLAFVLGWSVNEWFRSVFTACGLALLLGIHLRVNRGALNRLALLSVVSVSTVKFAKAVFVLHCFSKKSKRGIEIEMGSGNVFADLGLPDADKLKIKSGLVIEITKAMRKLGLTQKAAAERMGIPQPKVSTMLRGDFTNLSERKLMNCLNRLGYDIEIKVRPAAEPLGHLMLAPA